MQEGAVDLAIRDGVMKPGKFKAFTDVSRVKAVGYQKFTELEKSTLHLVSL
jgi:hypothetical protein